MSQVIRRSRAYYTLIASLPHIGPRFEAARLPITRIRLQERLKLLHPEDVQVVQQMQTFLLWDRQRRERTDEEVIQHYEMMKTEIKDTLVWKIVEYRMDVRTIMSGLRRRRRSEPAPPGVGQWVDHIRRNWSHPDFNLGRRFPWLRRATEELEKGNLMQVEQSLLTAAWGFLIGLAQRYHFSFEALVLYLARWEIVNRWTNLNAELGRERFEQLMTEALGEYSSIYE